MPIYEYECRNCGRLEVFQRITDEPLGRCPTCRSKVTKLISRSSFHLKGTGWYVTDYAGRTRDGTSDNGGKDTERKVADASDRGASSSEGDSPAKATIKDGSTNKDGSTKSKAA